MRARGPDFPVTRRTRLLALGAGGIRAYPELDKMSPRASSYARKNVRLRKIAELLHAVTHLRGPGLQSNTADLMIAFPMEGLRDAYG